MEFELEPLPPFDRRCLAGQPGKVRSSLAVHPQHGTALVTCFHGAAFLALQCHCGRRHTVELIVPNGTLNPPNGAEVRIPVALIDLGDEPRDVAWFKCPQELTHLQARARIVASQSVKLGDLLEVQTPDGPYFHQVVGLPLRGGEEEILLTQDRLPRGDGRPSSFCSGQSGSPVVNRAGELVAVVRTNAGHCGRVVV